MKSNPAVPGGSLVSKPTWSNTFGCSATSAFFVLGDVRRSQPLRERNPMKKLDPTVAQQIAQAVSVFQQRRTGYPPKAVTVVLSEDTLVVTLHDALSPAEKALAHTPGGRRSGAGVPPAAVQETPPTCCGRRSNESPGSRWARRPRKLRPPPAPWCRPSRPARWCRCSNLPAGSLRRPGTGVGLGDQSQKTEVLPC